MENQRWLSSVYAGLVNLVQTKELDPKIVELVRNTVRDDMQSSFLCPLALTEDGTEVTWSSSDSKYGDCQLAYNLDGLVSMRC